MSKIINKPVFYGVTNVVGNNTVLGVGYDNFEITKPILNFRIQKICTWHFIFSGSGTFETEDKKIRLKSGDMFFIPPDVKMRYYPDENNPWKYAWFTLNGETSEYYSSLLGFSKENYVLKNSYSDITDGILKNLLSNLSEGSDGHFGILSAFYKIMDLYVSRVPSGGMINVKEVIDSNCMSQFFSIEQLCRDIGISHAHLLRLFKAEYGQTLISYITEKRLAWACELLKTTDLSVKAVALSCGFSDEIHFMKTFKKSIGITALKYRKQNKP